MNHRQRLQANNHRIGKRLRQVRQQQQMTLVETAALSGIRVRRVDQLEMGQVMTSAAELSLLATIYEMPLEFFVHEHRLLDWTAEWQLLHSFRQLRAEQQEQLILMVRDIAGDVRISR